MRKMNLIKGLVASVLITAAAVVGITSSVQAAQIDINNPGTTPIEKPVFNTYTNVPYGTGNEADFVRLRKSNGDPTVNANTNGFVDPLNDVCAVGGKFDIRTYVHNGANERFNNNGSGSAVAKNVNVAIQAQLGVTKKNFTFTSTISASNAASKTDTGTLNCGNDVQLKLVPQTVKVYSRHTGWNGASDSAVNGSLKIGSRAVGSGDVWGCWEDVTVVVYVVEVVEAPKPAPEVRCDAILVERIGERKYRFNVRHTATNGASLKTVKYSFGDNNSQTVNTPFTAEHSYAQAGEYRVTTDLTFAIPGQADKVVTDAKCATTIKTSVEPCPTNPQYPKDDPRCEPCPTNPNLPKDDPKCAPCPTNPNVPKDSKECENLPPTIPSTGMGGILGGLMGTSAAGYGVTSLIQKRRALKK
jgi:hypothetical protein